MRVEQAWFKLLLGVGFAIGLARGDEPTPCASRVGVELDGLGDGARSRPFVDVARTLRPWTRANSDEPAPTDERGWPTCDAAEVAIAHVVGQNQDHIRRS